MKHNPDNDDFDWHALNYRTAAPKHAEAMWQELTACVERKMAAERERCIAWCRKVQALHKAYPGCSTSDDDEPNFHDGEACGAEDCVEAIQREGRWP